jgi:hypothetical protein
MAVVTWRASEALSFLPSDGHLRPFAQVIAGGGLGLIVFMAVAIALRSEETRELKGLFRRG